MGFLVLGGILSGGGFMGGHISGTLGKLPEGVVGRIKEPWVTDPP